MTKETMEIFTQTLSVRIKTAVEQTCNEFGLDDIFYVTVISNKDEKFMSMIANTENKLLISAHLKEGLKKVEQGSDFTEMGRH